MLFNSFEFLLFFVVYALGWPLVRGHSAARWLYIIGFSLFFYGWWDWRYVPLMVGTIFIDYFAGILIARYRQHGKLFLTVSLASNLLVLGYFKYFYFLASNSVSVLNLLGFDVVIAPNQIILPLGISFYTFQSMSYTIDIYRREIQPTKNILHFYSAVTFFPQLVAGPILRARDILPQLVTFNVPGWWRWWIALRLTADGFFRKVVIADNLAGSVNDAFAGRSGDLSSADWWLVAVMFAFQIYFDFSGYSNIARGTANFLGYDFVLNFNHPYKSASLREFWSRWHISLSTWFRDYVYIPLGGSRGGTAATVRNLMVTFTLSGLWHGAGWTFVIWGFMHGFFLSIERVTGWPQRLAAKRGGMLLAWAIVMLQVLVGWVFFRAENLGQAMHVLGEMFSFGGYAVTLSRSALLFLAIGVLHEIHAWYGFHQTDPQERVAVREILAIVLMIAASIFLRGPGQQFVYFQF